VTSNDWLAHWRKLYEELYTSNPEYRELPKPTAAHLDRAEQYLSARLPLSYREFIKVFGAVDLAQSFEILSPGYKRTRFDFVGINKQYRKIAESDGPEYFSRALFFAGHYSVSPFFWNTDEVTDDAGPEYRVYYLPRYYETSPPVVVAQSFREFIEESCLNGAFWPLIGADDMPTTWEDEDTGEVHSNRCFDAIGIPPNSPM
jgi:hypothetical protein